MKAIGKLETEPQLLFPHLAEGSRTEIMRAKRSSELQCKFQNRELEQRFNISSEFDYFVLGSGAFLLFAAAALQLNQLVSVTALLCALFLMASGLWNHRRRRYLYSAAALLIVHSEPQKRFLRIVNGFEVGYSWDSDFICVDNDHARRWHLGTELGNQKLLRDYPQLRQGRMVEVYLNSSTGMPLGMFVGDGVYWFI